MKKNYLFLCFLFLIIACQPAPKAIERNPDRIIDGEGRAVGYYSYENLEPFFKADNDTTYVINFWATWCKPCVEELPAFEKLYQKYKDKKVRLILVSLDFEEKLESKLLPFITKNKLTGEVIVLSQKNQAVWIDKVDPSWSGSLPATVIYNKEKRKFYEQSFHYDELETALKEFID